MMLHPDTMLEIARQRQEELRASTAPITIFNGAGTTLRATRRQIGQSLIRLGTWLGGTLPVPTPPTQLAAPEA